MGQEKKHCQQCGREIYFDGICVSCRAENERNRFLALSEEEMNQAVQQICREIAETGKLDHERELCSKLIQYRDINTAEIAKQAFSKGVYHPWELYKDAPDDVIDQMIALLMQDDVDARLVNNLLLCLSIHGGEKVFQAFLEWERNPRKWSEKIYAAPSEYAFYGGWSYDKQGNWMKTMFDTCYPMVKGTLEQKKKSPVKIGSRTGEKCKRCGCELAYLMEIDGRDQRLSFLGLDGVVKVKGCPNCVAWDGGDFCRYQLDGSSELVPEGDGFTTEDYLGEEGIEELSSNTYCLGETPVSLRYATDWEGGSSVGGFAFWIQDYAATYCPDCGRPMQYLAQIQWDTVLDGMEGNAYLQICKDCQIVTMLHQQT